MGHSIISGGGGPRTTVSFPRLHMETERQATTEGQVLTVSKIVARYSCLQGALETHGFAKETKFWKVNHLTI